MEGIAKVFTLNGTARRPLLGVTILLVEDSRYCSEAVRLMCQRSGARLRRADCLRSARRHLAVYRPDVVMVDIGLPDGSGVELIREMQLARGDSSAIMALSGDDGGPGRSQSLEAGAKCFLTKPLQDLASFQQVILSVLDENAPPKPFVPQVVGAPLHLDHQAFVDDLGRSSRRLRTAIRANNCTELRYLAQFTRSVAQAAQDHELVDCASAFLVRLKGGSEWQNSGQRVLRMVQKRLENTAPI